MLNQQRKEKKHSFYRALLVEEVREAEKELFDRGISSEELQEQMAEGIVQVIDQFFPKPGFLLVYYYQGNNGLDALKAALLLEKKGWEISFKTIPNGEKNNENIASVLSKRRKVESLEKSSSRPTLILDGLLGIGVRFPVSEELDLLIKEMLFLKENLFIPIISVDLPSGLDPNHGLISSAVVRADKTITLGFPKIGLLSDQATLFVGRLALIPFKEKTVQETLDPQENLSLHHYLITPDLLSKISYLESYSLCYENLIASDKGHSFFQSIVQEREKEKAPFLGLRKFESYKNQFGRLGIVAGSIGFLGAAYFAASAALASGVGLIECYVHKEIYSYLATTLPPEVMVIPIEHQSDILEKKVDAWVIGPGLGKAAAEKFLPLIKELAQPTLLDADMLTALSKDLSSLEEQKGERLLTPHPGEMERLYPCCGRERAQWARDFVSSYPVTLLLKGSRTLITENKKPFLYNTAGDPAMARGGMGDLLSGIAGALLAQGASPLQAAAFGSWLLSRSAELSLLDPKNSQESLTPTRVIEYLGIAFKEYRSCSF